MLAVGRLVRIVKTNGDKVISKSRFYNTFNYLGYEREAGDWTLASVGIDLINKLGIICRNV